MMITEYDNIAIRKIVTAVPKYTKNYLDDIVIDKEKEVKKKIRMTGVVERHIVNDTTTTADLCFYAAERLLSSLKWSRNEIRFLIFVSQTPNFKLPSTAFYLQRKLNIGKECFCFDVNLGCSGYVAGIQIISSLLASCEEGTKALLLAGDVLSRCIDENDSATSLLFGDAGTATAFVCEKGNQLCCMNASDGNGYDKIIMEDDNDCLHMDGASVFEFTINQVADGIKQFLSHTGTQKEIDYFVFHQAQKFIINNLTDILGINEEKVLNSYESYGNTSVASIPLSICLNKDKLGNRKYNKFLLSGFGVGLAWGNVLCQIDTEAVGEIVTIDNNIERETVDEC